MVQKFSVLIVDDEKKSREVLKELISHIPVLEFAGEASNVNSAVEITHALKPDLVLLDIEMPVNNGFEYVKEIARMEQIPDVIFVTAYDKYAIEAIRHSAFDYILKPVGLEDIKATIRRYLVSEKRKGLNGRFNSLLGYLSRNEKIKFDLRTGFLFVDPEELIYCEADGNYTHLVLEDGKEEVVSFNLGHVECQLGGYSFFRINRSVLVNLKHIKKLDSRNKICELKHNNSYKKFKISSSRIKELVELF